VESRRDHTRSALENKRQQFETKLYLGVPKIRRPVFGIHASYNGKVMVFAGGIPLKKDGRVVGAIGVSGGSGEQDHTVAEPGATAY
jgi:uncharacterized protein GlcG (DUF336 family)